MDRLKEEGDTLSFSASPTLTTYTMLTEVAAVMEDGIFMMQDDCSMDLEKKKVLPLRKDSFIYGSRWRPLMLTLAKLGRFLLDDSFSWEVNFQRSLFLFEHEQLHEGHDNILEDEFGIGNVKVADNSMRGAPHCRSPALSLRRKDPHWRSQILVEYSKDLDACMILND